MRELFGRATVRASGQRGYSLIEMMFVVGILGVVTSVAVLQIGASRKGLQGDGGLRVVLWNLNTAREMAISQRKYMRVQFTAPSSVQVIREDTTTTTSTIYNIPFEGGIKYTLISGLPDTPDAFGDSAAINVGTAVNTKFAPDGTLVNENGQVINISVFLALTGESLSARAVTVLGSTGRVRGYRWNGKAWVVV